MLTSTNLEQASVDQHAMAGFWRRVWTRVRERLGLRILIQRSTAFVRVRITMRRAEEPARPTFEVVPPPPPPRRYQSRIELSTAAV